MLRWKVVCECGPVEFRKRGTNKQTSFKTPTERSLTGATRAAVERSAVFFFVPRDDMHANSSILQREHEHRAGVGIRRRRSSRARAAASFYKLARRCGRRGWRRVDRPAPVKNTHATYVLRTEACAARGNCWPLCVSV